MDTQAKQFVATADYEREQLIQNKLLAGMDTQAK
jgi:hypothetical protein